MSDKQAQMPLETRLKMQPVIRPDARSTTRYEPYVMISEAMRDEILSALKECREDAGRWKNHHDHQVTLKQKAEMRTKAAREALSHILWIKDCGIDATDEHGVFRNFPEEERDHMYRLAKDALAALDAAAIRASSLPTAVAKGDTNAKGE